jgi:5-methylcytosine-specific restriction protein A
VRNEIQQWVTTYPKVPGYRDGTFAGAAAGALVRKVVPDSIRRALPNLGGVRIKGSAGQSDWAHTPWVALLHPGVTTSVQEGYYVVYLLSRGCKRLYLTIAQGCTDLMEESGETVAREVLRQRAAPMRTRILPCARRLRTLEMSLEADYWRARLYEAGLVLGVEYDANDLPSEAALVADLQEALLLYRLLRSAGGSTPDDEIMAEAREDRGSQTLEQAKRYRQHRTVERQPGHSKKVKQLLGTRCMGCRVELSERYGPLAIGVIDAHHLVPLDTLAEGEVAHFDAKTDFAVLCPNCHRIIHKLDDPSDLERLREMLASQSVPTSSGVFGEAQPENLL